MTRVEDSRARDSIAFALGVLLSLAAGILGWIRLVHIWRDKA